MWRDIFKPKIQIWKCWSKNLQERERIKYENVKEVSLISQSLFCQLPTYFTLSPRKRKKVLFSLFPSERSAEKKYFPFWLGTFFIETMVLFITYHWKYSAWTIKATHPWGKRQVFCLFWLLSVPEKRLVHSHDHKCRRKCNLPSMKAPNLIQQESQKSRKKLSPFFCSSCKPTLKEYLSIFLLI